MFENKEAFSRAFSLVACLSVCLPKKNRKDSAKQKTLTMQHRDPNSMVLCLWRLLDEGVPLANKTDNGRITIWA